MMNIFDFMYEPLRFDKNKPIKLFEAFSGIGTQSLALKYLGVKVDHIGISEIDKYAIQSYEAIHGKVKNYGGIGDFDRFPKDIDICTWSFPCQDISLAGKQKGMEDGTRSNYGYVFLDTIENMDYKDRPKVLLMENVKALLSEKFRDDWREIQLRLENMGYKNYADSLIATDYGVPQTRDRVFIVSVKGEYNYTFPKPIPLVKKLKDYLEDEVDEKYYLSGKQIEQIVNWKAYNKPLENAKSENDETIQTITAKSNTSMNSSMVLIKEATKQGYSIAEDGDGIYINRPHQKRGVVQRNKIQTIKTSIDDLGVVVKKNKTHTINGKVDGKQPNLQDRIYKSEGSATSITTSYHPNYITKLGIRKLTPLEAWRLMGIKDEDFHKAKSSGMSDTQLYKQAGNAIVVDVLVAIFKELIE